MPGDAVARLRVCFRRADSTRTSRGDAAAATWNFGRDRRAPGTDRSKIRIAGVVDEPVENAWWNLVNAGARDAAEDLGVTLLEGGLVFTGAADPPAFIATLSVKIKSPVAR